MPSVSKNYKSQYKQDQITDILLNHKQGGFFIDIGANDGVTLSNSYFFEIERNWDGICIEPIPEVFNKLKNNRSCILIIGAISAEEKDLEFTHVKGYSEMLSGISEYRDPLHVERTKKEIAQHGGSIEKIICKGYNLNKLLSKNKINKVDYLSIDIEGGEFEVLKSIDFSKVKIGIITVENNYDNPNIKNLLKDNGFFYLFKFKSDDFYTSNPLRGFRLYKSYPDLFKKFFKHFLMTYTPARKLKRTFSR